LKSPEQEIIQAKARLDSKFWMAAWLGCFLLFGAIVRHVPVPTEANLPSIDGVRDGLVGWSLHDFEIFYFWQMAGAFLAGMEFMACLVLVGLGIATLKDYYIVRKGVN
jgi:hypothetical protein